jgi:hypothetical protein
MITYAFILVLVSTLRVWIFGSAPSADADNIIGWNRTASTLALQNRRTEPRRAGRQQEADEDVYPTIFLYTFAFAACFCYMLIAVPIHATQAVKAKTIIVTDQGGSGNSTWTGCFLVSTPTDKWGFFSAWWDHHKQEVETFLSVF